MSRKLNFGPAIQSLKNGLSLKQVCRLHNIRIDTLQRHLKRNEIKFKRNDGTLYPSLKLKRPKKGSSETPPPDIKVCVFCHRPEEREVEFGKFHVKSKVSVHYYCLLFSCALEQNGEDDEGILGFLQKDILKEVQRGRKLKCIYCSRTGATVGCNSKCKAGYHFPCGLDRNAQYVFSDDFRSYCGIHRELQSKIKIAKSDCPICLDPIKPEALSAIYPPCCKKAWFHKLCLQKLALSAGYFFKCPLCNDKTIFVKDMLKMGVYVPEQDASWEVEPNAFADLLERPIHCYATKCNCSYGRDHDKEGTIWEIVLCSLCGSTGTHVKCAKRDLKDARWECSQCVEMLKNSSRRAASPKSSAECDSTFNEAFYPRKRKRSRRNATGESSGLSTESSCDAFSQGHLSLPSVEEVHAFASDCPGPLLDTQLQPLLEEIVPNYQLNIFDKTLEQFCDKSLSEIQMLILYQIYKPLSVWLDLRLQHGNGTQPFSGKKPYNLTKMENLMKIIQERMSDAWNSPIMDTFKVSGTSDGKAVSNDIIRIERVVHTGVDEECTWCSNRFDLKECPTSVNLKTGDINIICLACNTSNLMKNVFPFLGSDADSDSDESSAISASDCTLSSSDS